MKTLLISALSGSLLLVCGSLWAGEYIDEVLPTTADGKLSIDVMNGNVAIRSWDRNEVKVVGELDDDAEGYQFDDDNGRITFKVEMPRRRWNNGSQQGSRLEFWLPVNNQLQFEGVNTDVAITKLAGGTRINTVNGDIQANELAGRVGLETVNGKIQSTDLNGKLNLNTVNGKIIDRNSQGEVKLETVNGDIKTNTSARQVEISNVNGDLDLNLSKVNELEISTVNGDLNLGLSLTDKSRVFISSVGGDADIRFNGDINAEFNIEAHSGGDITNKLTDHKVKKDRYGPGESLRFEMGTGSAEVEINTVSGDIKLMRGNK